MFWCENITYSYVLKGILVSKESPSTSVTFKNSTNRPRTHHPWQEPGHGGLLHAVEIQYLLFVYKWNKLRHDKMLLMTETRRTELLVDQYPCWTNSRKSRQFRTLTRTQSMRDGYVDLIRPSLSEWLLPKIYFCVYTLSTTRRFQSKTRLSVFIKVSVWGRDVVVVWTLGLNTA